MDKVIRNYDVPEIKPMSTREFAKYLKNKLKEKKHKHNHNQTPAEHVHGPECAINEPPGGIEIIALAIVLDDVVVEVMNVQKGFADILLKGPSFVQINEGEARPNIGSIHKDGKFEPFNIHGVTRRGAE
jgi:hypothetical protein